MHANLSAQRISVGPMSFFVMERKHEHRLRAEYARLLEHKRLHVLDIPDDYRYMDPELVDMLEREVTSYLCI